MTDRELLEAAARVAGNGAVFCSNDPFGLGPMYLPCGIAWSPLDDDGDALRLAVKLGIEITPFTGAEKTRAAFLGDFRQIEEPHGSDPYAATRRAITWAAALAKD